MLPKCQPTRPAAVLLHRRVIMRFLSLGFGHAYCARPILVGHKVLYYPLEVSSGGIHKPRGQLKGLAKSLYYINYVGKQRRGGHPILCSKFVNEGVGELREGIKNPVNVIVYL